MSWVLAVGILAFVGIASSVLLWEGISTTMGGLRRAAFDRDPVRARAKLVVGGLGLGHRAVGGARDAHARPLTR